MADRSHTATRTWCSMRSMKDGNSISHITCSMWSVENRSHMQPVPFVLLQNIHAGDLVPVCPVHTIIHNTKIYTIQLNLKGLTRISSSKLARFVFRVNNNIISVKISHSGKVVELESVRVCLPVPCSLTFLRNNIIVSSIGDFSRSSLSPRTLDWLFFCSPVSSPLTEHVFKGRAVLPYVN